MAVNLLEEDRLMYHDQSGNTLEVFLNPGKSRDVNVLTDSMVVVDLDAIETLRDSLTCWLKTGKLK